MANGSGDTPPVVPLQQDLLPADNDDELTLAEKRAKRAQRKTTSLHSDIKLVSAIVTPPVLKNT